MMRTLLVLGGLAVLAQAPAAGAACESLTSLELKDTTISLAQTVAEGQFTPPGKTRITGLPVFCRVVGVIRPTADSQIGFEVWMPQENWSGRFVGIGNSYLGGAITYDALPLLGSGSALASTDTGHTSGPFEASWAMGHPEKVIDFGYRSVHLMTVQAKAIVAAFYGKPAARSYWLGCSCGGGQGLSLAQRYPADYDGIVAGAPANYETHLDAHGLWILDALKDPASVLSDSARRTLVGSVITACDPLDGVRDGVIEDPRRCQPDLASITCKGGNTTDCLTEAQVAAARKLYSGASNPRTGEMIHPGFLPGSEGIWSNYGRETYSTNQIVRNFFRYIVFEDPTWDWRNFDSDFDVAFADGKVGIHLNTTNPDLRTFRALGNKLLQWHGWSDAVISPLNSVQYYESVQAVFGSYHANGNSAPVKTDDFYRLFMIPGVAHCGGGNGITWGDSQSLQVIAAWVEDGKAPDRIVAGRVNPNGAIDRTRPLCPYPQMARWTGTGSPDDAENWVCSVPDGGGRK